jgi:hypothetical protein
LWEIAFKSLIDFPLYRLDFDQFMIGGPEIVNHVCNNDQFIVSGGSPVPAICGTNTGNHSKFNKTTSPQTVHV